MRNMSPKRVAKERGERTSNFELTEQQRNQLNKLISMLIYYSKFSPTSRSSGLWLIKVPLSRLQEANIAFSEAKGLLNKLYKIVDAENAYIQVLNGTIGHDGHHFYTTVDGMFDPIEDGIDETRDFEENLIVWVRNPKAVREGVEIFLGSPVSKYDPESFSGKRSNDNCWIKKNDNGNFFFDGARVVIKNSDAEYMRIFNVVYSLAPQGGRISYAKIVQQCKAQYRLHTNQKKIQRALTGKDASLFRFTKDIPSSAPNGVPFFVASKSGKMLEFNNQK